MGTVAAWKGAVIALLVAAAQESQGNTIATWAGALVALALGIPSLVWAKRAAGAADLSAASAKQSAGDSYEANLLARTPGFKVRFVKHCPDWFEAELILLGPAALERVDFEVALCHVDFAETRGSVRLHQGNGAWIRKGSFGQMDVADVVGFQVPFGDFWLRLSCANAKREVWKVPLEVAAHSMLAKIAELQIPSDGSRS